MVKEIYIDDTLISVTHFDDSKDNGAYTVSIKFDVTSEEYHDIAVLLYKEVFDIRIPEKDISFRGKIYNYSTSLTNLYKEGEVAQYRLVLTEVPEEVKD